MVDNVKKVYQKKGINSWVKNHNQVVKMKTNITVKNNNEMLKHENTDVIGKKSFKKLMSTKHGKGIKQSPAILTDIWRLIQRLGTVSNGCPESEPFFVNWYKKEKKRHDYSLKMRSSKYTYFNITYTFIYAYIWICVCIYTHICIYIPFTCSLSPSLITARFWLFPFHNVSLTIQSSFKCPVAFPERE